MKRIPLIILSFLLTLTTGLAQVPDAATQKAIRKSIQKFAWESPNPMMENYAWLQQQEMPYFARDTFTMTWAMDGHNLIVLPYTYEGMAWKAIFDPVWPNGGRTPIPERYQFQGQSCRTFAGQDHYLEDIGFAFGLDSSLNVLEVESMVEVRENGILRWLTDNEMRGVDFPECIKVTYRGDEAAKRHLVGQHHRTVVEMKSYIDREPDKIRQLLDRAVRESYAGFRILSIDQCEQVGKVCWYRGDGLSRTIRTYGKINAATGPEELEFEAVFHFPEGEEPEVYEVRIFK